MSQYLIAPTGEVVVIGMPAEIEQRAIGQPAIGVPRMPACRRFKGTGRCFPPAQPIMLDIVDGFEFENGDRALAKEEDQPEPTPQQDRGKAQSHREDEILEYSIADVQHRLSFAP